MLTYSFDKRNKRSMYEYLYSCIKDDIISGKLTPDTKLPSKRDFAKNHGISVVTVENAYGQLLAEGYIYSISKKGFYVSSINNDFPANKKTEYEIKHISKNDFSELGSNYINLISGHTVKDNFPFSIWAKLMRHVLTYEGDNALTVPPTGGVMKLREAIAHHLYEFRGITVSPEQIIIGAGTEYLYGLIVQLLGRNLSYGLENPSSKKIINIYKSLGVKVNYLDMDSEGVIPDCKGLRESQIIQISPSHHFPTGIVTSISRRYGLLQWANKSADRYIIEDDYDSEFRLQGKPIPSLFSIDATDKVIYFNTFTKSLASTIRISYMVLPIPLLERFKRTLGFYSCTVSNFEQYTLAHFIDEGYLDKHINRMRNHYRDIRDELISRLMNSNIKDKLHIYEENSGLHFLLKYDTNIDDDKLKQKAIKNGLLISFLSEYIAANSYALSDYEHIAIVNYSGLSEGDIEKTAQLLISLID